MGLVAGSASADQWRLPRRDPGRTAAASGTLPLESPAIKWRSYLGGRPQDSNVRFGMNSSEVLVASVGGRFVARDAVSQAVLWTSDVLGAGTVADMVDLTGDASKEVIVQTATKAHVLDAATGNVLWSSPGEIEIMGAVRAVDLSADGVADLYLDNGIGAKPGVDQAAVFTFAGGPPTKLWSVPITISPQSINAGTDALIDVDQDGIPEAFLPSWDSVLVLDASSGSTVTTLTPPSLNGHPYPQATAIGAELDGDTSTTEVLILQPNTSAAGPTRPGLAAYSVDVAAGTNAFLFAIDTGTVDAEAAMTADVASDLDGDGLAEVIFSHRSSLTGDTWSTEVLAGSDGTVLASLSDARFEGAADLDGQPGLELVVAHTGGLRAYTFDGTALSTAGNMIPGMRAVHVVDQQLRAVGSINKRLAVLPWWGNQPLMLVGDAAGAPAAQATIHSFDQVRGYTLHSSGSFALAGSYDPPVGVVTGAMRADFSTRPYEQVALGTSEGFVAVLSRSLQTTNGVPWVGSAPLGTFVGGGNLGAPPLASQDADGPFIVLPGTAVGTVVADARSATMIEPPLARWWEPTLGNVAVIDLGGQPHIVGVEQEAMVARQSSTGVLSSSAPLAAGWPWGSPVPLVVAGQSDPTIGMDWRVDGGQIVQTAVNLSSGLVAWTAPPQTLGGYFGSSAGDIDGDGTDEWFSLVGTLVQRDAATGASTVLGSFPQLGYSLPLVAPFQGTTPQLLLQAGGQGPKLVEGDSTVVWETSSPEAVNGMAGSRVSCSGQARFVTPAVQSSYLRAFEGATGTLLGTRSLAGGQVFASVAAAEAAGHTPGTLSHATSVADLSGTGPAVFVGSSDGHLYALDACTLDLRWALDFGASLGEPVVANVDDDADEELMVPAADGYLYGLDLASFAAPLVMLAADDGSEVTTYSAGSDVEVSWPAIDNATGYEVALVTPDQKPVWSPAFKPVSGTSTTVSLAGALASRPYLIAVRAVGTWGVGFEGLSKPVQIADVAAPQLAVSADGGDALVVDLDATDDVSLDHYLLRVHGADGAELVGDGILSGQADQALASWVPAEEHYGSDLVVSLSVIDSAGLLAARAFAISVTDTGAVVMKGDAPVPPSDDAPIDPGEGPGEEPSNETFSAAGGCSSAGSSKSGSWLALVALGLAVGARRRRRRA